MSNLEQIPLYNESTGIDVELECNNLILVFKQNYDLFKKYLDRVSVREDIDSNPSAQVQAALIEYADSLNVDPGVITEIENRKNIRKEFWDLYIKYNEEKRTESIPEVSGSRVVPEPEQDGIEKKDPIDISGNTGKSLESKMQKIGKKWKKSGKGDSSSAYNG